MKNKLRLTLQLSVVAMIFYAIIRPFVDSSYHPDFEAFCPFGGIASLMSKFNLGSSSCQMGEVQMLLGISLIVGAVIFGKLFCSYLCPIGTFMEWLGRIGERFHIRFSIPEYLDRPLRLLKYSLLFYTLYITMNASELFCKEYDPYLASVTFFQNPDVVWYFAVLTLAIVIAGSLFTKMFWCKYLCPLGAIGNIFSNALVVIIPAAIYFVANAFGADLGLVWLLGGIVGLAAVSEIVFKRNFFFPLFKITRDDSTCPTCIKCDTDCPQGIEVSKYNAVDHVDCTLCTDCVYACPVNETLSVNKTKTKFGKYIAPVGTIVLILAGLIGASFYEFTTLDARWGGFDKLNNVKVFHKEGLTSVKCFGSATSFKNQISRVKGIVGLDAYASSHTVDIYYNPDIITELDVKKSIFKPIKQKVRKIDGSSLDSLSIVELGIENFFDNNDFTNLTYTLRRNKNIFGFETLFGEPVQTKIYYRADSLSMDDLKNLIESEEVDLPLRDGTKLTKEINFEVSGKGKELGKISVNDYQANMFKGYNKTFNKYKSQKIDDLKVLIYPMPEAGKSSLYRMLSYLTSHLSNWKGIVRLKTKFDSEPKALVYFNKNIIQLDSVKSALSMGKLKVHFRDGKIKFVNNPFKSKPNGVVINAKDLDNE